MISHPVHIGADVIQSRWAESEVTAHHYGHYWHRQLLPFHLGALGGGQRLGWDVELEIAQHLSLAGQPIAPRYLI